MITTLAVAGLAGLLLLALLMCCTRRDAVTLLTVWLVLLWGLSAGWVLAPLGAVGTPAAMWGVGLFAIWVAARLAGRADPLAPGLQPVRLAIGVYLAVNAASYAMAHTRVLTTLEASSADRRMILLASLAGVALLAADGIDSRARLDTLLRRSVTAAGLVAAVAALHFFAGVDLVPHLRLPGLSPHDAAVVAGTGGTRSLFAQPRATAGHPIELGVILAMALPLALHYALVDGPKRSRRWFAVASGLIAVGIPLTVSRSGIIGVVVAMGVMALVWSWRWRLNLVVWALALVGAMWAVVPGLIGTLRSLLEALGADTNDPSIIARRERVPKVIEQLDQNGFFGLGPGTFTPEDYFLLDNQYYGTVLELGWPGVFALIMLLGVGITLAVLAGRGQDPTTRHLAHAIVAALAVVPVAMATFDAFAFQIFSGMTFLLVGVSGALWRLTAADRAAGRLGTDLSRRSS